MGACSSTGVHHVIDTHGVEALPLPLDFAYPILGNPPKDVNIALEFTANCSRASFVKAWVQELAYKIVTPGDGVTQSLGFEDQVHGMSLSNGAVFQEKIGPLLAISMKTGSASWTVRGVGKLPPFVKGITNIIEVTEESANKIKIRMLGRFHFIIVPTAFVRNLLKNMYLRMIQNAESM